jgi:hypothetical protein
VSGPAHINFPTISIHHQKGQHVKETSLSLMIFIVLLPFFEIYKKIRRLKIIFRKKQFLHSFWLPAVELSRVSHQQSIPLRLLMAPGQSSRSQR